MKEPKRDFIFIDESGDPGDLHSTSSSYYIAACIHVTDIQMEELLPHFVGLRFFQNLSRELKPIISNQKLLPKILDILNWHDGIRVSAVHLTKKEYSGPYLSDRSPRGKNPRFFQNFVIRQLLEHHFSGGGFQTDEGELVFDRISMTFENEVNLRDYINENWNLPDFSHITFADSRYVECLQIADLIAGLVREKILEENPKYDGINLGFVDCLDITTPPRRKR